MTDLHLPDVSRRGFLKATGLAAGLALVPGLAACAQSKTQTSSGGGTAGTLKFWDMPWAQDAVQQGLGRRSWRLQAGGGSAERGVAADPVEQLHHHVLLGAGVQDRPGGQLRRRVPGVPVRRPGLHRHGRQPDLHVREGRTSEGLPARARSRR